jgi:hypothetical protein
MPRHRFEDRIKNDHRKIGCEVVNCVEVAKVGQ